MKLQIAVLMAFALLASPVATAAVSVTGPDEARVLSATGTETVTYTVTVDCTEFVNQGATSLSVTLDVDGLPEWFGASAETVSVAGQGCVTGAGAALSVPVDLTFAPTSDAWGHLSYTYSVTATAGSSSSSAFAHAEAVQVEYVDGHVMTPSISFPYNYTGSDPMSFNLDLEITANGNTMIMFIAPKANGTVSGLAHQTFFIDDGSEEPTRTLNVTWQPPSGNWESDTISFYTFSHCLKGSPCGETNEQNVTWTIYNDDFKVGGSGGDSKGTPGPAPVLIGLALVAAALVARRK